jgi:hypothetical protein
VFQPQPQLALVDAQGNTVAANGITGTATLVAGPPGFVPGDLMGTPTAAFVNGIAQFAGLYINK